MTAPTAHDGGRLAVDPRFRERRIEVRKQAGLRRLRRLVLLVVVALLALSAVVVLESPILDVDAIDVSGAGQTDVAAITEAAAIDVGSPLLLADLEGAERRVEALPWVAEAVVTRDLPAKVSVAITERSAAAMVTAGETTALVDERGRALVVATSAAMPADLAQQPPYVAIEAPEGVALPAAGGFVDRSLLEAIGLAGRLRENPAGAVATVHLAPPSFDLVAGGRVALGDLAGLDAKIEAFRTVHARVDLSCLDTIDLRVPTHPVLTRRPGC